MLEGVPPSVLQGVSVVGISLLVLTTLTWALWKGLIFTRPQVDRLMEIQEGRVKTAEERESKTQALADKWADIAQQATSNNEANIEQGRMIVSLLQAAQQRATRR